MRPRLLIENYENVLAKPRPQAALEVLARSRTVFHTPTVLGTHARPPRHHGQQPGHRQRAHRRAAPSRGREGLGVGTGIGLVETVIIDEAERLHTCAPSNCIRDIFDRTGMGVILIGMPGMEKRLSRYPQLYSRVGFAHHYRPLQGDELTFVLTRHWRRLGLALDDADFTDAQAVASIARITGGNFRLLHRLFVQIGRILKINGLSVITDDVVEAARSTLVIGAA